MSLASRATLFLFAICVAGCGGNVAANVTSTPEPALSLSTTSLAFPSTTVGSTSASLTVVLTDTGSATLTLPSIALSDTADYSLMSTCGASLSAGGSCTLSLAFTPQTAASLPATITISNSAGASATVNISGTGTAVPLPVASLTPTAGLSFPATAASSTAGPLTATLANTGSATLTIPSITLGGTNPSDFSETTNCTGTLAGGSSCSIYVSFTPAAASTSYAATLTITDNSGGVANSTQSIALIGSSSAPVTVPVATLSTTSLTFSPTPVNTAAGVQNVMLSNTGTATLTGIAISITGGTTASAFSQTSNCGSTLSMGANCTIAVNFTPTLPGSYSASLSLSDNASGSPQTVGLSGTGTAPVATFSSTSIAFPVTKVATTSASYGVSLTNTGNGTLSITSIVLGGTNAANFAESTTCVSTLAPGASCTISATFTPAAPVGYGATITVTYGASGSPQAIALSGTGTTAAVTRTLYIFPEPDNSVTPLYTLINNAQKTIDMTMYALEDTTFTAYLVADCKRGVVVRVILDQNLEKSGNTTAFNSLNAQSNCSAVWANTAFQATHEKAFVIDGTTVSIMSLNLQSQYYSTTRDFALVSNDASDIAAVEATFSADYAAGTTSGGTVGASDFSYNPGAGDDLIWSPTTAQAAMLAIINNATTSIVLENEEMGASNIVSALEAACQRGVTVRIAMVSQSSYATNFKALEAAGSGGPRVPGHHQRLLHPRQSCGRRLRPLHPECVHGFHQLLHRLHDREPRVGSLHIRRPQRAVALHDDGCGLRWWYSLLNRTWHRARLLSV